MSEVRWWLRAVRCSWRRCSPAWITFVLATLVLVWFESGRWVIFGVAVLWVLLYVPRRLGRWPGLDELEFAYERTKYSQDVLTLLPSVFLRVGCSAGYGPDRQVPSPTGFRWDGDQLRVQLALPPGLVWQQLAASTDAVALAVNAHRVRVEAEPPYAAMVIQFDDALAAPFELPVEDAADLRAVPMGLREDGQLWTMRLGPQTLVAGASGSGKASVMWGLLFGLAPAIHQGLVEVHGIDLKSAMELGMGPQLLARFARTPEEAVVLLEDAVASMRARAYSLAGTVREHTASSESPHVVVLVDEIAALTAYVQDRELQRRASAALALLCSQGRAVGYTVFACLQDPRKETLPMRGLFTQTIALRLRDAMETAMVLGEGMKDRGALCHRISPATPGVAYVVPDDGTDPVRVRAAVVVDERIREVAARFPAPTQIPVVVPAPETPEPRTTRGRASRSRSNPKEER